MQERIETKIIRAQQNNEIVEGINPIQTEREDDSVVNILTKYKNVTYELTP